MSFKDHFSTQAASYRRARPQYPHDYFDWLSALCHEHNLAWDAGCGNGQASGALAEHFVRVVATDPSAAQIAQAEAHPAVEFRIEAAEASTLADGSVDLVSIAQALHWFDHPRFYAEVRRVARPGAVVAAVSYGLLGVGPAVDALIDRVYDGLLGPYWPVERRHVDARYGELPFPFEPIKMPNFVMSHDWTLAQTLEYLQSWSAVVRYRQQHGVDPIAGIADEMAAAWGAVDEKRTVTWSFFGLVGRVSS